MGKKGSILILVLLVLSLAGNVYLFQGKEKYKDAWLNQFIATSDIESIFKASGINTSFENIKSVAIRQYGAGVEVIEAGEAYGADRKGLKINDTILLFKDGHFYGSKANLPDH